MTHLRKCGACGHTLQLLCTVGGQVAQKIIGLHNRVSADLHRQAP